MIPVPELMQEYKARLRSYIARRVSNSHDADDLLQEVFLKAYTGLHGVKSAGSVSAWLYRIASNVIADYYRSRKPMDELPESLAAPEREQDYVAELASCLQPFIDDLPEKYRDALQMVEINGIKQKELATRLGISISGAKSRVQRGRELLRHSLSQCCEIETGRSGGIIGYEVRRENCDCGES